MSASGSGHVNPNASRDSLRGKRGSFSSGPRTPAVTNTKTGTRPGLKRLQRSDGPLPQRRVSSVLNALPTPVSAPHLLPVSIKPVSVAAEQQHVALPDVSDWTHPEPKRRRISGTGPMSDSSLSRSLIRSPSPRTVRTPDPDARSSPRPRALSISSGSDTSIPAQLPLARKEAIPRPAYSPARRDNSVVSSESEDDNKSPLREPEHAVDRSSPNMPKKRTFSGKENVPSPSTFVKSEGDTDDERDLHSETKRDPPSITMAGSRAYTSWIDEKGLEQPTYGALLPGQYIPDMEASHPWVCPVRSCRSSCTTLRGLGGHFNATHRAKLMNDCLDGTLCEVGQRMETDRKGALPAKIVSTDPLPPQSSSTAPPSLKVNVQARPPAVVKAKPYSGNCVFGSPQKSSFEEAKVTSEAWQHIASKFLPAHDFVLGEKDEEELLLYLMDLPRQRNLAVRWAYSLQDPQRGDFRALVAMLIQVTGKNGLCNNCSSPNADSGGHVYHENCVALPSAPLKYRKSLDHSCCNCYYFQKGRPCAFAARQISQDTKDKLDDAHDVNRAPVIKSAQPSHQPMEMIRLDTPVSQSPLPSSSTQAMLEQKSTTPLLVSSHISSSAVSDGRLDIIDGNRSRMLVSPLMIPTNGMGMEDWEFAPGRRVVESDSGVENIAYSAPYLTLSQAVSVGPNATVQILGIKPGTSHTFEADGEKTRICSVSSGKIKVKFDALGEEFFIGHRGVFTINYNTECVVENWFYEDATITVFSTISKE